MTSISSTAERTREQSIIQVLADEAPVGVCIVQDGRFCYVNSYFSVATGYTENELIGKDSSEIVVPEDRDMVRASTIRMLKEELLTPYQFRVICKDGSIIWVMATVRSIQYHGKKAVLGNYMEITGRRQAEEELQAERNKLQSLVDAMEDGLTIQDRDYNIIYQGRVQRSIVGDHLGEKCYRVYEGREEICEGCPVQRAFKDGKSHTAQRMMVEPSGKISFWENTANPIKDASGEIISCLEINRNITERKKQEQALADELTQRRLLIDKSLDGIVILDEDGRVVEANQCFAHMLGYSLEEVYGLHTWDWDKNFPPKKILEMGRNVDDKGLHLETKHTRKDCSVIDVDISISAAMCSGRKLIFCVQRDVTDRNRAEEALEKSEERYKELTNSITDVFFAMDEHLRYTYWNKTSELLTGIRAEDAIGKSLLEMFPDSPGRRKAQKAYRAVLKTRRSRTFINDFDIDGKHYVFEITAYPSQGGVSVFVRDITDHKEAEERLRQSEERYRTILEEMQDAYFEVDLGGHLTFFNDSVCRDLGYSRQELMGISYKEYTVEEDIESLFQVFNEVYETGLSNKGFPWRTIRKDGNHGFAETSISPIRDDSGAIIGFRGVGRDITERMRAEEKLQQSTENYRALFDSSVIGTLILDAETMKVLMANEAAMKIFGFSSLEEAAAINVLDFVPQEERDTNLELIKRELFGRDSRQTYDVRAITKDGRDIWINVTGVRMLYQDRTVGMVTFTDVTDRKQAEDALRQSEENYRALFDSSVIGTIVLDADTLKIVMANRAATEIFGFSSLEEVQGIDPLEYIRPEDKERVVRLALDNLFGNSTQEIVELGAFTKDGRELWITATGAKITHEGRLAGLISFTDITEQKRQNDRLLMTDRLASLGELASGAAHELNNPLTSIIGFSQLLMEKEVPDDIHEDLRLINNEARRAVIVTNNLLSFARKHSPTKQLNQIHNIIEDVLEIRAHEHGVNHINVERHFDPALPEIMVDYFQMQQVFMNIIINAEYFMTKMHNGGTLTITTSKENSTVKISFADDGPGITDENLGRIFDPFFTTKEAGSGTGLGLSICHGIVNEHGGQIYVRSQLGKGASIFIELPIKKRARVKSLI